MAGNYPDVPSWRIPWDRDGTQVYANGDNIFDPPIGPLSAVNMQTMNDESDSAYNFQGLTGSTYGSNVMFLFPQPMNLYAAFIATAISSGASGGPQTIQTSTDTTNGVDGIWTNIIDPADYWNVNPYWRTSITTFSALGVVGARFRIGNLYTQDVKAVHWFGEIASGNPDRLEIWHPTLDQRAPAAWFDWGNVPRGSSADVSFRVKNLSSVYTANSVAVSIEAFTDTTPSVPAQHYLNLNGGTFAASQTITSIAPGAISQVLVLRRITPTNATLSLWAARVKAIAGSWT